MAKLNREQNEQLPEAFETMQRIPELRYGILDELLGYALRRAQNALYMDFYRATEDFGLSPQRFAALVFVGENPGIRQTVLSAAMSIARSGAMRLVDWFEAKRLAERREDRDDARAWGLHLTLKGERLLGAMREAVLEHDRAIVNALGKRGREFQTTLARIESIVAERA